MDARFRLHVDALRPSLRKLLTMPPVRVCDRSAQNIPDRGVYLLSEGRTHVYVGRSNAIQKRLSRHCRNSSRHNSASFAFLLARETLGFKRHQFTREALMQNKKFPTLCAESLSDRRNYARR
jgi:hypothetical protein